MSLCNLSPRAFRVRCVGDEGSLGPLSAFGLSSLSIGAASRPRFHFRIECEQDTQEIEFLLFGRVQCSVPLAMRFPTNRDLRFYFYRYRLSHSHKYVPGEQKEWNGASSHADSNPSSEGGQMHVLVRARSCGFSNKRGRIKMNGKKRPANTLLDRAWIKLN